LHLMRPGKGRQQTTVSSKEYAVSSLPTPYSLLPTPYCQKGFSLLEIVMVVAIIGLMAGTLAPLALHLIGSKKAFTTRDEMQALKKAIIGDPLATQWGSEATFGYIGDTGNLPASLQDLYTQPGGVSSFSLNTTLTIGTDTITPRIGSGWRGPYVAERSYSTSTESLRDPHGNTYIYDTAITTDATLGAEVRATIRSPGPNRTDNAGTQDDLTERILKTEVLTDVTGTIKNAEGAGIPTTSVSIIYPSGSSLTSASAQTDDEGRYSFSDIPMGQRAIFLQPGLVYVPGTAYATGSSGSNVSFQIANLSSSNITASSIKVYALINPYTYYSSVWINGTRKDSLTSRIWTEANTTVSLTANGGAVTLAGSTMRRDAFLTRLQSSRIEIPDIELTTIGAGSTMTVEVKDFYDALTGGSLVNMAGIPFKITFSNGSKALFTPKRQS
ncbi:MAG: prepilin-type N-terminal cleavage/methylation domain-containing protein, partial [Candidatus Brocadiaceae bacterium]|nr:prepilin-type N-terminal cleavage/methylation domain-containing protein [Candidatus Brocadiaceae bacterium]